ncbi:MAG: tyrosine-type recombinase/integrase [Micromonosporaceae bacterium]
MAVRRAIFRWRAAGAGAAVVSGRSKVLCAALTFAVEQGLLRWHPLAGMRRPPQPLPRLPLPLDDVQMLLRTAAKLVADAEAAADTAGGRQRLFEAEQTQLLAHLAADSAARRGELAAFLAGDLAGRVLSIHQAISGLDTVTCPKTHQYRSMTLGSTTANRWHRHLQHFPVLERGQDWLFAPDPDRATFIHPRGLAARFERLRAVASVPHATLHRLRHTVAVILVAAGHLLAAQHRLGHRDASTTLRHYGWVLPPDDTAIADQLEVILTHGPGAATSLPARPAKRMPDISGSFDELCVEQAPDLVAG